MTNPPTDERRESGRLTHKDGEVLDWIRERLVNVHGDEANADFIHALERVRLRVHAQAALSHQGEVVKVSDLDKLARKWDAKSVRDYGQKSSHAGDLRKLLVANGVTYVTGGDLTALISKAEKV